MSKIRISITVSSDLVKRLKKEAVKKNKNFSATVEDFIRKGLEKHEEFDDTDDFLLELEFKTKMIQRLLQDVHKYLEERK